jgi:hypothetical protein
VSKTGYYTPNFDASCQFINAFNPTGDIGGRRTKRASTQAVGGAQGAPAVGACVCV